MDVAEDEVKELYIEWSRNGKSIQTKRNSIDHKSQSVKFYDKFKLTSNLQYDTLNKTWIPDISILTLFSNKEQVGSVQFDLANYIGRTKADE